MRNLKVKLLAFTLIASFLTSIPVYADSVEVTSEQTVSTSIKGLVESNFVVSIPKTIIIDISLKIGSYEIALNGDIKANEYITVLPSENIIFKTTNKNDVSATVQQSKTEWKYNEFSTTGNGTITATDLSAGNWNGVLYFDISLNETLVTGLFDVDGNLVANYESIGMNVDVDYTTTYGDNHYATTITSPYYALNYGNKYPTATKLVIPDTISKIGSYAFYGCSKLTDIVLPESITSIGSYAFSNCTNLTNFEIPYGIAKLETYTFANCKALKTIIIPDTVTSIDQAAFLSCTGLETVYYTGTEEQWNAITFGYQNENLKLQPTIIYNYVAE